MRITHDTETNAFRAWSADGECIGEILYEPKGERLIATSTHVEPRLRGQGVAHALLDALVEYAKEENAIIVPVCSYVAAAFERYPVKYAAVIDG